MPATRLSRQAEKDEEGIVTLYVEGARTFGIDQAEAYHARLERTFELIDANPGLGREHAEFAPPVRIHPHRAPLVIYRENAGHVLVVRVPAARQDWTALLGGDPAP